MSIGFWEADVIDQTEFEAMKDEYYGLRGRDKATGFQTKSKLEALGLPDIGADLTKTNLIM